MITEQKLKTPHIKKADKRGDITIWTVDGEWIRDHKNVEFTNYGEHYQFPFIPKDEFWLDQEAHPDEQEFFIESLLVYHRYRKQGLSHDKALKKANQAERRERERAGDITIPAHKGPAKPEDVDEKLVRKLKNGVSIYIVNGRKIRSKYYRNFTEGGHDKVYPWIRKKTIYIDDDLKKKERPYIAVHELPERRKMDTDKWPYLKAHRYASRIEWKCRHHPGKLKAALKAEGWEDPLKPLMEGLEMENMDRIIEQSANEIIAALFEGGEGSGNWGHSGRPGIVGGSQPTQAGSIMKHLLKSQHGGITSSLFRAARLSATAKAFLSGSPIKMGRRATNILVGRKAVSHLYLKGRGKRNKFWWT